MTPEFSIEKYAKENKDDWNDFVAKSKNGTFLFDRNFMDYHSDRFEDMSLIVRNRKGRIVALLPGNQRGDTYYSHQGLTYGGLIMDDDMTTENCLAIFSSIINFLAASGITNMVYKAIPHIYHKQPAEEDIYALYRNNAEFLSRVVSTTINLSDPIPLNLKRRQKLRKAEKCGLTFYESDNVEEFLIMVDENLRFRHGVGCVHTPGEMRLLKDRLPKNIRLFISCKGDKLVAGALLFVTDKTVHTQYMCASPEGRKLSALDYVIDHVKEIFRESHLYIDFGHSTEYNGYYLNSGLISQKEGFGGRAIVYDTYRVPISPVPEIRLVEFDDEFVGKSGEWLQHEELRKLINLPEFDIAKQISWVNYFRSNPEECIVRGIVIDGNKAGACGIKRVARKDGIKTGEYWGYIGEPEMRGKGSGTYILNAVEDIAREKGIKLLTIKVVSFNYRAIALYKKCGFSVVENGEELLMEKYLE